MTTAAAASRPCARDRLLAAADELFYAEGVQTVGIDRVIERADVAKASLYNLFGSKDGLVRAYLLARHERNRRRFERAQEGLTEPRDRLLAVFDSQTKMLAHPTYHGCAFANATAEAPEGSAAAEVTAGYRAWLLGLFADLAAEAGASEPQLLARQLQLLYDGTGVAGRLDADLATASASRAAAAALFDAATA